MSEDMGGEEGCKLDFLNMNILTECVVYKHTYWIVHTSRERLALQTHTNTRTNKHVHHTDAIGVHTSMYISQMQ